MINKISQFFTAYACLLTIVCILSAAEAQAAIQQQVAQQILDATGVKGGLIVHIGCGDGSLTATMRANERYLVHGLDVDPDNIEKARQHIRSLGLYGKVSVEPFRGNCLPYVDNLVNLVVSRTWARFLRRK